MQVGTGFNSTFSGAQPVHIFHLVVYDCANASNSCHQARRICTENAHSSWEAARRALAEISDQDDDFSHHQVVKSNLVTVNGRPDEHVTPWQV